MEAHAIESPISTTMAARRITVPAIRWSAIFAGAVAGLATYMLLTLLGIAVGLTAADQAAGEGAGAIPIATAIWSSLSMLIAAFVGGYVAARMSGLARRADGLLHGFVAWATVTVLFAWLATTTIGNLLGGAFGLVAQGAQAAQQGGGITQQLQSIITGTEGGEISGEDMSAIQSRLQAGDRNGAVDYMVNQMGFTEQRATTVVDNLMPVVGPGGQGAGGAAQTAVNALSAASWWLFAAIVLSLIVGVWGGLMGVRATSDRTLGDHSDERHYRTF
ncbi:MAG: hypothetical protein M0R77_15340 [Gammaproteobacteria bacterium]|nr:hypothetical protein [Gammaproteobacteria bacterium]